MEKLVSEENEWDHAILAGVKIINAVKNFNGGAIIHYVK